MGQKKHRQMNIEPYILSLVEPSFEKVDIFVRAHAYFSIASFMEFPVNEQQAKNTALFGYLRFAIEKIERGKLTAEVAMKALNLHDSLGLISESIGLNGQLDVYFDEYPSHKDLCRQPAKTVRFLLAFAQAGFDPSLRKCHYFFKSVGHFGQKWSVTWRPFHENWKQYRSAAALIFVDEYYFNKNFRLSPLTGERIAEIEKILLDVPQLSTFFGRCLEIQDYLLELVDRRAVKGAYFPHFPKFDFKPIQLAPLSKSHIAKMQAYRSSR